MLLVLSESSRVLISLRATGLLRSLAHSPTLTVRPQAAAIDAPQGPEPFEAAIEASVRADAIRPPDDLPPSDARKMRDNLVGPDVLDARRFPTVDFRGRYAGTMQGGALSGDLRVRAHSRRVTVPVRVSLDAGGLVVRGAWEGRLSDLGVTPFRALLGAIRLDDWIGLHLDLRLEPPQGAGPAGGDGDGRAC